MTGLFHNVFDGGDDATRRGWSKRYIRLREREPNLDVRIKPPADNEFTEFEEHRTYRFRTDDRSYVKPTEVHEDPDEVFVFLGGSSTACRYVEEEERFPYRAGRLLEEETGIEFNSYNAGVSGSNSLHSINSLLNKVLRLDPDYIVFCHNWNDLNILLFEEDYRNDNPNRKTVATREDIGPRRQLLQGIYRSWKSVAPRTAEVGRALYHQLTSRGAGDGVDDFGRHRGDEIQFDEDRMLSKFRGNLNIFISICRNYDVEPVLMTQQNRITEEPDPVIRDRFEWFYDVQKMEYTTYKPLYDRFNDEIRDVAATDDVTCIDLAADVPSISEYMYDVIHFKTAGSQYGSRVIADTLADEVT